MASQNSSVEIPRCVMHSTNSEVDLNLNDDRNPNRCPRIQNSSHNPNYVTPRPTRHTNYQSIYPGRPETPKIFGGRGQTNMPYEIGQFELSQNEHFRSPRGVFQNLDYDRFQTHRSPMPPRLTDEVIDSFENARVRRGPLNEVRDDNVRQQLCARLQTIRDGMNKKPQIEIEHQIEVEPKMIPYERITLQEPCEDASCHQETEQDLGILSESDMDDDGLFGNHQTIDPRTIFKTKDENLVSRNVVKIETNTTINGSKREVIEEILEKEDVNVIKRTVEDENLVDISEPTFESLPRHSFLESNDHIKQKSEKWKFTPRRVLEDYSNLAQEDLEDISKPSFQQGISCQEHDEGKFLYTPRERNQTYSGRPHTCLPQVETSERLDEVSQPGMLSSIENTYQDSTRRSRFPLPQVETSEQLDNVSHPRFLSSIKDTNQDSRGRTRFSSGQRPLPQGEISEKLDQANHPGVLFSVEDTYQDSSQGNRYLKSQKPLPQIDTSERLDEVSQPQFLHSTSHQDCIRRTRCPMSQRPLPQIDTSERLDEISNPSFMASNRDSRLPSRRERVMSSNRRLSQFDTSERLDEVSQPKFLHSTELSHQDSTRRTRCPMSQRPLPQIDTSERLDEISNPSFMASNRDSTLPSRREDRRLPQVDASERLDEVSQPQFLHSTEVSHQDSIRRTRCPISQRRLPQIDTSERLDEISNPSFMVSNRDSRLPSRRERVMSSNRRLPQVDASERLEEVSQPQFLHSTEVSHQDSTRRTRCPMSQRPLPQIDTSERLDEISNPSFMASNRDSTLPSRRERVMSSNRRLSQVDASERLDEVSQPQFLHSTEVSHQDSTRRTRCPMSQRPLPQIDTSERLDRISHPRFLSSFEDSYGESTQRTKCPTSQRPLPQMETSERIDQISYPRFSSSIEDSYKDSQRRRQCPLAQRTVPQVEISERLDQVSQPSYITSFRDSSLKSGGPHIPLQTCGRIDQESHLFNDSRGNKQMQPNISNPEVDDSEMLDEVCQPEFESSYADTSVRSRGNGETLVSGFLPHVDESERLDDVSHPEYPSSYQISSMQNTGISRQNPKQKLFSPVEASERLENICQPEFSSSLEDNKQRSKRQTHNRIYLTKTNVTEMLDDVSQPFCPSSFEDSMQRSNEIKPRHDREVNAATSGISGQVYQRDSSSKEMRSFRAPRFQSQVEESEMLDGVTQPDLTSLEDTGYQSKDSFQGICPEVEDLERVEDISQPHFHSTYGESTLRSRENRRVEQGRPFKLVDISERLDNICQPDFPNSFEDSMRLDQSTHQKQGIPQPHSFESNRLQGACQQSFQSSLEDYNRRQKRSMYTPHPAIQFSSGRKKQDPRQRLLSRVHTSERLDDVSQPFLPSSFEDSIRPVHQVNESDQLKNVSQPVFHSSLENSSRHTESMTHRIPQRSPRNRTDTSERLNDVSQPIFPTSFDDSMKNSGRYIETPRRRPLPVIDVSEKLEDVCHPSFGSSFEESSNRFKRCENIPMRRPFPQIDESKKLDDESQPDFVSTLKDSTAISRGSRLHPSHVDDSGRPCFENIKQISVRQGQLLDNRPFPQINISERLNDISQPDFPTSFENSAPRIMRPSEPRGLNQTESCKHKPARDSHSQQQRYAEINIFDDVCKPSFEDSKNYSRRNKCRSNQESFLSEKQQNVHPRPNVSRSLDRSDTKLGHLSVQKPHQFDTSEILEDVIEPEFPPSFQGSMNVSSERSKRIGVDKRAMPQIDLSENIESVCQPEFPVSFEDSTRNHMHQNVSSTYRKNKDHVISFPQENLDDISAPIFHSSYKNSMQRGRESSYFPQEILEDISCPSFQPTPKLPPKCREHEDNQFKGPKRQLFPKQDSTNEEIERPGDFGQVFESMPNYAPFEKQVASKRNPVPSRLKLPVTFDQTTAPLPRNYVFRRAELIDPRPQTQPSHPEEMRPGPCEVPSKRLNILPTEDFRSSRMRPQKLSQANPGKLQFPTNRNQMEPKRLAPTVSSTRIPLPPSARPQKNILCQEQRSKEIEIPANQERLVKKSSVKFHQTKSTYFKNKQDKSNERQRRQ